MRGRGSKPGGGKGVWLYAFGAALLVGGVAIAWAMSLGPFAEPVAIEEKNNAVATGTPAARAPAAVPAPPTAARPGVTENQVANSAEAASSDPAQANATAATGQATQDSATDLSFSTADPPLAPQRPRPREEEGGLNLWVLLPAVLAGLLGGLGGAWLLGSGFRRDVALHLQDLKNRVGRLEKFRQEATAEIERLDATPGGGSAPPQPARPFWMKSGDVGETPSPPTREQRTESSPPRASLSPEAIAAQYSQLAQGNISRSAFESFFGQFGTAAPADIIDNGRFIQPSVHEDSLLTSVTQGGRALVFPSYAFIANSETQFTTMASAPGAIQHLFDLSKGGGGLVLDRPALFEDRGSGLQLVEKGALRGFQG